jgi:hypothetical protein
VLRCDGELVASLVPALAAAPWLAGQAALGRAPALRASTSPTIVGALAPARAAAPGLGKSDNRSADQSRRNA